MYKTATIWFWEKNSNKVRYLHKIWFIAEYSYSVFVTITYSNVCIMVSFVFPSFKHLLVRSCIFLYILHIKFQINYTCQQKKKNFHMCSSFQHFLERNYVLNTMLPSNFSWTKQFSRDNMLTFQKIEFFFAVKLFITLAKKLVHIKKISKF